MNGLFLVFIFFISFLLVKAQTQLSGKYKFHTENDELGSLTLNCDKTFLLEDTMIVSKDSSLTSIVKGSWTIRNGKVLVLFVGSIIAPAKAIGNLEKLKYNINGERLYLKLQNRRQYERENKRVEKISPTCLGIWEDYETFRVKQNNRYFQRVDIFQCM